MSSLLKTLISEYDFVVIDTPPLLPVTDALTLSKLVDGAIIVARYKSTRRFQLDQSLSSLVGVSARVLGVVLNGDKTRDSTPYYGYAPTGDPVEYEAVGADFNDTAAAEQREDDPAGELSGTDLVITPVSEAPGSSNSSPEIAHRAEEMGPSPASGSTLDDASPERTTATKVDDTAEPRVSRTVARKIKSAQSIRLRIPKNRPVGKPTEGSSSSQPAAGPS